MSSTPGKPRREPTGETGGSPGGSRRILALCLLDLLVELAVRRELVSPSRAQKLRPRAVILHEPSDPPWEPTRALDAVNATAHRLGLSPRQTLAQARALCAHLSVHALPRREVSAALRQVADVALGYGTPVSIRSPDTVWVDVSGTAHLFSGEQTLASELLEQVRSLGYSARAAIADGPWLSRALARHGPVDSRGITCVDDAKKQHWLRQLPVTALPLRAEASLFFARLGLLHLGQLQDLPRSALATRLQGQLLQGQLPSRAGPSEDDWLEGRSNAPRLEAVLDLIAGFDPTVLVAYQPDPLPEEQWFWDESTERIEPLLFVLRGLAARIAARLEGRGQAAQSLVLTFHHDPSIFVLRGHGSPDDEPQTHLELRLASPLEHARDIERIVQSRLTSSIDSGAMRAPTIGLSLRVSSLTEAHRPQLELRGASHRHGSIRLSDDPRTMAVLLGELASDVGSHAVGVLVEAESLLLEKRSRLVLPENRLPTPNARTLSPRARRLPTRLFAKPIDIGTRLAPGAIVVIEREPFVVGQLEFEQRLEDVEWWRSERIFRDYFRSWLRKLGARSSPGARSSLEDGVLEALLYWDRHRQRGYLHALYD